MALRLIVGPGGYPVTLAEAKAHCRIDHSDDDDLIEMLIAAATAHLDGKNGTLQRALKEQTWELSYDAFPCGAIEIPLPPLISVTSVKYDDSAGDEQTIDDGNYVVDTDSEPGWVVPISGYSWPTPLEGANVVRIRFTCGYTDESTDVSTIPQAIKAAILIMVGDMYDHRESITAANVNQVTIPTTVERLLNQYRVLAFA